MHRRKERNKIKKKNKPNKQTKANPTTINWRDVFKQTRYKLRLGSVLTKQSGCRERAGSVANSLQSVCITCERGRGALSSTRRCSYSYSFPSASTSLSSSCGPDNSLVLTSDWKQVQGEQASSLQFGTWSVLIVIQLKAVTADSKEDCDTCLHIGGSFGPGFGSRNLPGHEEVLFWKV